MTPDMEEVVERLSQSAAFAEETGRNRCDSIPSADLRALLSALRQRDEALRRARRYVADLPIVGDADLALIDAALTGSREQEAAILTGSETNAR